MVHFHFSNLILAFVSVLRASSDVRFFLFVRKERPGQCVCHRTMRLFPEKSAPGHAAANASCNSSCPALVSFLDQSSYRTIEYCVTFFGSWCIARNAIFANVFYLLTNTDRSALQLVRCATFTDEYLVARNGKRRSV